MELEWQGRVLECLPKIFFYQSADYMFNSSQCNNLCHAFISKLSKHCPIDWHILGLDRQVEYKQESSFVKSPVYYNRQIVNRAWKEVYRAIREAELYLQYCSSPRWWIQSVHLSTTGEAHRLHIHDLVWSILCLELNILYAKDASRDAYTIAACRKIGDFYAELSNLIRIHDEYIDKKQLVSTFEQMVHNQYQFNKFERRSAKRIVEDENRIEIAKFLSKKIQATIRMESGMAESIPSWLQLDPKYLIPKKRHIGNGSYGAVYEGSWLGLEVAVKEIPDGAFDVFQREALVLVKLQSPFIVQLIGTCIKDECCYLVMELVSSSLEKKIEDNIHENSSPFPFHVAIDIMLQISRGMEYLHSQKIMHMDLKASNVLIQPSSVPEFRDEGYGHVKLCDFGMAGLKLNSFRSSFPKGTSYWRAPEAFAYPQDLDKSMEMPQEYNYKADVYSFAMTCYEILTGKQPFEDVSSRILYNAIAQGKRPILPSSCPPLLADYIKKCWHTDPSHRPCFPDISKFLRYMKMLVMRVNDPYEWASVSSVCKDFDKRDIGKNDEELDGRLTNEEERLIIRALDGDFPKFFQPCSLRQTGQPALSPRMKFLVSLPDFIQKYSYNEVQNATNAFNNNIEGVSPSMWMGVLSDGKHVAVKESSIESFLNEVTILSQLHHPNIIHLCGVSTGHACYLVYDHMVMGSLDRILFRKGSIYTRNILNWNMRRRIILGIARSLAYLHEDCGKKFLNVAVNTRNIMLDERFTAKLCGFGLATSLDGSSGFPSAYEHVQFERTVRCISPFTPRGTPEKGIEQRVLFTPNAAVVKGSANTTPTPENGRQCISPFTPNAAVNEGSANKTPGWVYRSSLSPGDEFWNDAIQVADGLVAAKTDDNIQGDCDVSAHVNSKDVQESLCSDKIERCKEFNTQNLESHNAVNRVLSGNEFQQSPASGREVCPEASEAPDLCVSSSKVPMPEECTENNEKIHVGRVGLSKTTSIGSSALPVRHFSFLFEDNITLNNAQDCSSRAEDYRATEIVNADTSRSEHLKDNVVQNSENQEYTKKITVINRNATACSDSSVVVDLSVNRQRALELAGTKGKDLSEISIREKNISTPSRTVSLKDNLELCSWLPDKICDIYAKKGITKLYPWQVECLQLDGVLERRNLVYCASTSAGKSLVAEILLLRRVIATGKSALLVLPYVSICAEKSEHMETLLEPLNKRVRSFYGNQGSGTLPKDTCLAVCTIEKANSLVNRLLEEGRLAEIGIMVIDELHMVGDQSRGYLLELMLTKLRYATGEGDWGNSNIESPGNSSGKTDPNLGMQIVGMSATMPNVRAVSNWLQAALYETEFRPVPLDEFIKVGNIVYNKQMEVVRVIPKGSDLGGKDPDHVVELCNEVVQSGQSVLVFCSTRKACETTAKHIAKFIKEFSCNKIGINCQFKDGLAAVEELRKSPAGLDATLAETVPFGVAYHHAGLTVEEREIVETCYKQGIVRVLTATSTLAAGVNLPARRVVFRQPRIGRDFIDGTKYRQMAGRAGRAGIDTKGESILICKPEEVKRITNMLNEGCPPLQSCLSDDKNGMKRAILEVVAGGIVQTANDINRYVRCTLLNSTQPFEDVVKSAQESLRWLCHGKFLEWDQHSQVYSTTPLGRAAFGSSLSPEESLTVLEDLARAREGFVLASDLHMLYEITPINVDIQPDWELYYQRFMELCPLDQAVGNRVGIMEPFLMRMAHGAPILQHVKSSRNGKSPRDKSSRLLANRQNNSSPPSTEQTLRVCRRFYVALMLAQLVQEVPLNVVCEDFKVPRGMIQALQESAGRFASMITAFCERLGWHDLEGLVSKFQNRVSFGVRAEIAELTSIPFVKAARARALYKAGLRTAQAVAEASLLELVKALFEASSWAAQDGSRNDMQRRIQIGVAKKIKNGARQIVLDQAEEARVAAFTAFKALGLNVPLSLSQPIHSSSSGVFLNQDISETLPEKLYDENNQSSRDSRSELCATDNQITTKYADKDGITTHIEERTKSKDTISFVEGSLQNTVDNRNLYPNDVNDGKDGQPFVGKGVSDIEILQKRSENRIALGKEINIVSRNNDKSEVKVVNEGALIFSGLSVEHETNQDRHKVNETVNPIPYNGPIDVNDINGGFEAFLNMWELVNEFCFDLHFSNGSVKDSLLMFEMHGLAICWDGSPVYYVSFSKHSMDRERNDAYPKGKYDIAKERWEKVAKVMCRKGVKKITWSLKNQFQAFMRPGISMPTINQSMDELGKKNELLTAIHLVPLPSVDVKDVVDLCLVAWLLWPDEESTDYPTLEQEVKKRLSGEVAAAANRAGRWINQMGRVAHNGCCRHVAQVRVLHSSLWKLIVSEGLDQVLGSLEMPLVKVLADMESWGIGIDMEVCWKAKHVLECKLRELEDKAQMLAGVTFSLSTPADVANVLYSHLKLSIPGGCNKGKQHPSTDKHVLDLLRNHHPVVGVIKEHRTLAKLLSCTVNTVLSRARLYEGSKWYCVRGHWLQTSTATGRLSMEEPNLQRVEHEIDFTIESNEIGVDASKIDQHQINARDFFVPTQENWLLISADYSQIELRLMAHFSEDSSLISLLKKPDGDVFIMMAARWTGKDECAITEKQRDQTKKLIYGILYGMGVNTLAEQLECSLAEASEKYERFRTVFPGVSSWLQRAVDDCRQKGYITTLSGRKRFLGKINFGNRGEQAKAERQAVNSICQGSAADIIKMAMIKVHSAIAVRPSEGDLVTSQTSTGAVCSLKGNCRLLLQIHDELLLEVKPDMLIEAALLVRSSMEGAACLKVPLRVKLQVGRTWGSLTPFKEIK